jgi:hypothetical protein
MDTNKHEFSQFAAEDSRHYNYRNAGTDGGYDKSNLHCRGVVARVLTRTYMYTRFAATT